MKVRVTTISTKHNPKRLRTKTFTGHMAENPRVGEPLVIIGRGLTDRNLTRLLRTSLINSINPISQISTDYHTENSVYRVTRVEVTTIKARV